MRLKLCFALIALHKLKQCMRGKACYTVYQQQSQMGKEFVNQEIGGSKRKKQSRAFIQCQCSEMKLMHEACIIVTIISSQAHPAAVSADV